MSESKKDRVLTAAREVFLRYGYKRVSMADIAEAAGISRPALYLLFKNKEDIFSGVFSRWVDDTLTEIETQIAADSTAEEKLAQAFEIWAVRPFEIAKTSPEAQALIECTFGFAQPVQRQGYARFEATISPVVAALATRRPATHGMTPEAIAHVLASAVLGLKQTASSPAELRQRIKELLALSLHPPL